MARQQRSSSSSSRRTVSPPARSGPAPVRSAAPVPTPAPVAQHSVPAMPQAPSVPATQSSGPGFLAQVAGNAVSIGVGSAVGHVAGRMMYDAFGRPTSESAPALAAPVPSTNTAPTSSLAESGPCAAYTTAFLACLKQHGDDVSACQHHLQMMKDCRLANGL